MSATQTPGDMPMVWRIDTIPGVAILEFISLVLTILAIHRIIIVFRGRTSHSTKHAPIDITLQIASCSFSIVLILIHFLTTPISSGGMSDRLYFFLLLFFPPFVLLQLPSWLIAIGYVIARRAGASPQLFGFPRVRVVALGSMVLTYFWILMIIIQA
jgi:hypothetical protein